MRIILMISCGLVLLITTVAQAASRPPNFVIIFTDDQGYQDVGCYGSPLIKTPNLDRMAAEGVRFTDFYSANSVCSPSRAALLTGCYPTRVNIPNVLFPQHRIGLHPDEITIADLLKTRGYATACLGKWHLGHLPEFLPTRQGFDFYYGIPYSNDMTIDPKAPLANDVVLREGVTEQAIRSGDPVKNWVPLMRNEEVIEYPVDQTTLTERYTDQAIRFIEAHRERPFFLYLPHTMPHIPLFVSEQFEGRSSRGLYGDVIEEIDASVGRLLDTIRTLGLDEQTLVIFTSDNGPWKLDRGRGGSAEPLRGFKFSTYEGGMRVPCIMRWPGTIPAGETCREIAGTIDFLPTLATLAGVDPPADRVIDGRDLTALLKNPANTPSPHDRYYYYRGRALQAVREGPWKLRLTNQGAELFHLQEDISETTDLSAQQPERVAALRQAITVFDQQLRANARPAGEAGL